VASVPVAQHKRHLLAFALATTVITVAGSMEPSHKSPVLSSCGKATAGTGEARPASTRQAKAMAPWTATWLREVVG
jgi:hypothetical protein